MILKKLNWYNNAYIIFFLIWGIDFIDDHRDTFTKIIPQNFRPKNQFYLSINLEYLKCDCNDEMWE